MKSKQAKFLLLIVSIIIIVIGIGFAANKAKSPGKYDEFAKALSSNGAVFYGAFWCPHCQATKTLFGSSKQYLPYVECSNPDQSVTKICVDEKIEGYPTWKFKDGIALSSDTDPTVCKVAPGDKSEPAICQQPGVESANGKTWIFPGYSFSIHSATEPIKTKTNYKFTSQSWTTGEVPLEFLASQIGYTLPQ